MTGQETASGPRKRKGSRGFARAGSLVTDQLREAGASRGFAVSRLLTHWEEIAGPDIAAISRPVDVKHGRGVGLGGTLTLLTTGAHAPMLEMQKETLRARVNACYGYAAIASIRLTQTAATGFAEGRASFTHAPSRATPRAPDPQVVAQASDVVADVADDRLRQALEKLGQNVLTRDRNRKGSE